MCTEVVTQNNNTAWCADSVPCPALGRLPSIRRAVRAWMSKQQESDLSASEWRDMLLLLDRVVHQFQYHRGSLPSESIQNRLSTHHRELYDRVMRGPRFRGRWHRFLEACAPIVRIVPRAGASQETCWRIVLFCRDGNVWEDYDVQHAVRYRAFQERLADLLEERLQQAPDHRMHPRDAMIDVTGGDADAAHHLFLGELPRLVRMFPERFEMGPQTLALRTDKKATSPAAAHHNEPSA